MVCWFVGRVVPERAQVGQGEFGGHWRRRVKIAVTCPCSLEKGEAVESVPNLNGLLASPNFFHLLNPALCWAILMIKHLLGNLSGDGRGRLTLLDFFEPKTWGFKCTV